MGKNETLSSDRVNMPHSFGIRAGTRDLYSRPYRARGTIAVTTYLTQFKVGEMIDIKANSAVHRGMPHKFYHGKTGVIYNVTKRGLGVIVNKTVGNRIMKKRINIRHEHCQPSRCREDFLRRVKENDVIKNQAAKEGRIVSTKRKPVMPREGFMLKMKGKEVEDVVPELFEDL